MLAKLGITSPFSKRKIKELQSSKQMLLQQQQQQQQQQIQQQSSHHVSNIPTPKKLTLNTAQSSSSQTNPSNLPVYQTNSNPTELSAVSYFQTYNTQQSHQSSNTYRVKLNQQSSQSTPNNNNSQNQTSSNNNCPTANFVSSESSSSGISCGSSSNKTTNSSRSTSPSTNSTCESNAGNSLLSSSQSNLATSTTTAHSSSSQTLTKSTKLPQLALQQTPATNSHTTMSIKDAKRKSSLPKGLKTQSTNLPNNTNPNLNAKLQNTLVNNNQGLNIVGSSKLQSPATINLNSYSANVVDSKTVKKLGSMLTTNIKPNTISSNNNNNHQSTGQISTSIQMPSLTPTTASIAANNQIQQQQQQQLLQLQQSSTSKMGQSNLAQSAKKQSTNLTFGLPKLTKLTSSSSSGSDQYQTITSPSPNSSTKQIEPPKQMITLSQVLNSHNNNNNNHQQQQQPPPHQSSISNNNSKIPSTKGHLKSPSIQISKPGTSSSNATNIPSSGTNKSSSQISQIAYGSNNGSAAKKISAPSVNGTPKKALNSGLPTVRAKIGNSPQLPIIESTCNSASSSMSTFQVSSASSSITRISFAAAKSKTAELELKSDESTSTISTTTKTIQGENEDGLLMKSNDRNEEEKRQSSGSSKMEASSSQFTDEDDEDKEILGIDELDTLNPVDDNDEEFKKFLNSDEKFERIDETKFNENVDECSKNIKLNMSPPQLSSPPPPPPPIPATSSSFSHHNLQTLSQNSLPSPPHVSLISPNSLLLTATTASTAAYPTQLPHQALNLNSFGRSNTLDRKLKPLITTQMPLLNTGKTSKLINESSSAHFYSNSLERNLSFNQQRQFVAKNGANIINRNNLVFSMTNSTFMPPPNSTVTNTATAQTSNASVCTSPQRNSLNIPLKTAPFHTGKRPLSQDPMSDPMLIMSNSFLISSSASSNDIISFNNNNNNSIGANCNNNGNNQFSLTTIQQLKSELENARSRILTLTNQLNTNGQIVNALEQNLSALTLKLQKVSISAQKKENLIGELKAYIDYIHTKYSKILDNEKQAFPLNFLTRHNSTESVNSLNSMFSQRSFQSADVKASDDLANVKSSPKKRGWLRNSFSKAFNRKSNSQLKNSPNNENGKKCLSDVDENDLGKHRMSEFDDFSLPNSPMHQQQQQQLIQISQKKANTSSPNTSNSSANLDELEEYQRLLRDKEIKLTDIRLESLATAHQLDQTKEENLRMKIEIEQLRSENVRMQQYFGSIHNEQQQFLVHHHHHHQLQHQSNAQNQQMSVCSSMSSPSPTSSVSSSSNNNSKMNLSLSNSTQHVDLAATATMKFGGEEKLKSPGSEFAGKTIVLNEPNINDGKRVLVAIHLGNTDPLLEPDENQILIGSINISTRTNWDAVDSMIKSVFREYIARLDSLGLSGESLSSYCVGEMPRSACDDSQKVPDLLPYGYLVGNHTSVVIRLKDAEQNSADSLCFDTLVPKNVLQRYLSLIHDYRNLLFCGPSGTGKSYLSRKIGEHLARKHGKDTDTSIAYFNVENKSGKELKNFLSNLIEQANVGAEVPLVLILDNLHFVANNADTFSEFFSPKNSMKKHSYVIGTVNEANVTSLNLHSHFKWVLLLNHAEPVKSYLGRFLHRRLVDHQSKFQLRCPDLEQITKWIPKLWHHVNKYIENFNSVDLTLGPKLFSTMPMDLKMSQAWFVELWNNVVVPYLVDAIKEGLQVYGLKTNWEDPKLWISESLPWGIYDSAILNSLYSIEAHHVGIEHDELNEANSTNGKSCELTNEQIEASDADAGSFNMERFSVQMASLSDEQKSIEIQKLINESLTHQAIKASASENDKLLNMLLKLQEATFNGNNNNNKRQQATSAYFNSMRLDNNEIIQKSLESSL